MARLLLALALFAAGTDAFLLPFAPRTATAPLRAAVSMGLEEAADKCIEEGCPIDLVDELIAELKGERPYPARTFAHVTSRARTHHRADGARVPSQSPATPSSPSSFRTRSPPAPTRASSRR